MPRQCPNKDARKCTPVPSLPRLCPDLSATVYGARIALAAMARALGKNSDADHWLERAETLRHLILKKLYVPDDPAFYDFDAHNHFVRINCDILSRICGEHVLDQKTFDTLWSRQLANPHAFWPAYPLPSVALDDPTFVRPIPRNSWGGPSQALTALRAGRWFDHYHRSAEFAHMMQQWCDAILRDPSFRQQLDPLTGDFTQSGSASYSPCALVLYDYTWRLAGVRQQGDKLHWNINPECPAAKGAIFRVRLHDGALAELRYHSVNVDLRINGNSIGYVQGSARLITDLDGKPASILGTHSRHLHVTLQLTGRAPLQLPLSPNNRIDIRSSF
jgi:hypothetical protein